METVKGSEAWREGASERHRGRTKQAVENIHEYTQETGMKQRHKGNLTNKELN